MFWNKEKPKPTWKELLKSAPIQLPAAHDALTAKMIESAGFSAYQIGGFALAGADGIYVEAPKSAKELQQIGKAFGGVPQMTNMFEGDDETPWLTPKELSKLGFSMILYPTTILFRIVRAIEHSLEDLKAGKPSAAKETVRLEEYEKLLGLPQWAEIEKRFQKRQGQSQES